MVPGEIETRDLEELGNYVSKLSAAGLTFFDRDTASILRKRAELPEEPEDTGEASGLDVNDPDDDPRKPPKGPKPIASTKPPTGQGAEGANEQAAAERLAGTA